MTARDLARKVLLRVEGGGYANLTLASELAKSRLSDLDRAFTTELVYGVLKNRSRLDRALAACTMFGPKGPRSIERLDPTTLGALRLAADQILFLRVPDHAAVDDTVRAVKKSRGERLAGFANALLRRLAREGEPPVPEVTVDELLPAHLEITYSFPSWLVEQVLPLLGPDGARAALAAWNEPAPTWLRINTLRTNFGQLIVAITNERPRAECATSALVREALSVVHGGDLFSTEAYRRGDFLAQDLGAQLVGRLVDPQPGERILDACAGVGGKSTHLAALTRDEARIDAADVNPRKLELCADHCRRLGVRSVRTVVADLTSPAAALQPVYDRVLLDAPCSGLGVLRRHPELKWRRAPGDLAELAALQAQLLDALAPRVRPGGLLVYAVCTFTADEGPGQVARFLERHPEFTREPPPDTPRFPTWVVEPDGSVRTWPHRDNADAFYSARLRRAG
jgi:16S rRNA (cytosine967-C5)-methyltransferase